MKIKKYITGVVSIIVGMLITITAILAIFFNRLVEFNDLEMIVYIVAVMLLCFSYVFTGIEIIEIHKKQEK